MKISDSIIFKSNHANLLSKVMISCHIILDPAQSGKL